MRGDVSERDTPDLTIRGLSSVGRAPALQAGGQGFDPPSLHEVKNSLVLAGEFFLLWRKSNFPPRNFQWIILNQRPPNKLNPPLRCRS
jgi:hypothetical protein